jgi:hypothetical protein
MPINLIGFGASSSVVSPNEALAYPSSIASFSRFKDLFPDITLFSFIFYIPSLAVLLFIFRCLLTIIKDKINNDYLIILSVIILTNIPLHVGGYAALLYLPIIGLLYRNKEYLLLTLIMATFFCNIWDFYEPIKLGFQESYSYLSTTKVNIELTLTLGSIIRPAVNFLVLFLFFNKIKAIRNVNI